MPPTGVLRTRAMAQAYDVALMSVTGPTVKTQFTRFNECWDIPMVPDGKRLAFYESWLESAGPLTQEQWSTIKRNWISFLSATNTRPSADLAPSRFLMNIMPMDLDLHERMEAIQYNGKVFMWGTAMRVWGLQADSRYTDDLSEMIEGSVA